MDPKKIDENTSPEELVSIVRNTYGAIASGAAAICCGPSSAVCCGGEVGSPGLGYAAAELDLLPEGADLGLGCGAPVKQLDLKPGETVLDLGSGAGIDVFLAARQVGAEGFVIGVDMTPEMLETARANAVAAGVKNVDFRAGRLEALPVDDSSVDAITSNCVINLVPDKSNVFAEAARVLKSGGRMVVSDIVLDGELPEGIREDILAYSGCVSGALPREEYLTLLKEAGFAEVEILKDKDFLAMVSASELERVANMLDGALERSELEGVVRSITYRAKLS